MHGIIIDSREHQILDIFGDRADFCRSQLSHGDFVIGEWTASAAPRDTPATATVVDSLMCIGTSLIAPIAVIERKTLADFAASIVDGRIQNLYMFAKTAPCRVILLVEGVIEHDRLYGPTITGKNINSAILYAQLEFGIHVMFTSSMEDTCKHLVTLNTVLTRPSANHRVMSVVGAAKDDPHGKKAHSFWRSFAGVGDTTVVAIMEQVSIHEALSGVVPTFSSKRVQTLYGSIIQKICPDDAQMDVLVKLAPRSAKASGQLILDKANGRVSNLSTCTPKESPISRPALKTLQGVLTYKTSV